VTRQAPSADTALAAAALALNLAVLYAPRAPAVDTGGLPVDKLVHAVVFALPTIALARAGVPRGWAVGLMALHAPASELLQAHFLRDRSGEVGDVVADLVGVGLGAMALWWPSSAPGPGGTPAP
jgi:VanZ family protein